MNRTIWEASSPLPEIRLIGRMHIQQADGGMPFEYHEDCFELLLLESGSKRMTVAGQRLLMHGGDVLLMRPGEPHGDPESMQNRTSMVFVIFPDPACTPDFLGLEEEARQQLSRFLHERAVRLCRVGTEEQRRFASLCASCKAAGSELSLAVRRAHFALLLEGYQRFALQSPAASAMSPEIALVVERIAQARDRIPSVRELAAWSFLSESRFKQKFRQQTGIPPMEYVLRQKLKEAMRLMQTTDKSIPRIAAELGFSSDKHFSDAFRRYMGKTPMQYMKTEMAHPADKADAIV